MVIHYGVVGNIQASHVCAPGSIPGDGVFFKKSTAGREQKEKKRSKKQSGVAQW